MRSLGIAHGCMNCGLTRTLPRAPGGWVAGYDMAIATTSEAMDQGVPYGRLNGATKDEAALQPVSRGR